MNSVSSILLFLPKEKIEHLYWEKGLSTRKLASVFNTNQRAIIQCMNNYGVPRRERIEAVIKGCKKYEKRPFSGNLNEKAYIMGFTFADLRRRLHGRQINLSGGTTHPAFTKLFREIFQEYAPIRERPVYNRMTKKFGWTLECELHESFNFLLEPKNIPDWIKNNDEYFLKFFAGYTDGEGTICISKNSPRCVAFILRIASEDKEILTSIYEWLKGFGMHPSFTRVRKAGDKVLFYDRFVRCSNDHWALRLKRKNEVIRILEILPLRHEERVKKKESIFKLKNFIYQCEVNCEWDKLKGEIRSDILKYSALAEMKMEKFNSS
jgi:hypothetical protein